MNQDTNGDARRRQRVEPRRSVLPAAALASLAVLAAGCGGGGSSAQGATPFQQAVA